MGKNEFELGEITDDVIIYVDKYIKLLMSNIKYSFLEKYNSERKIICSYIQIKENDLRFSYQDAGIEKILSDIYVVEDTEITIKNSNVSECLDKLSNREREVILRNIVLNTPLKKIAFDIGVSERMVKYYKKSALNKMRKDLGKNVP